MKFFLSFWGVFFLFSQIPIAHANDLKNLEEVIHQSELRVRKIFQGNEKKFIWANPENPEITERAIVYIHGFSASRQEISPVVEDISAATGANAYFTRLAGHGLYQGALENVTVEDWLFDAVEALEIGRQIGKKVTLVGTSTGGTLALKLAHDFPEYIDHVILVSPNLGVKGAVGTLLPYVPKQVLEYAGNRNAYETTDEAVARVWSTSYPFSALGVMIDTVQTVKSLDFGGIHIPLQVFVTVNDDTVDISQAVDFYNAYVSDHKSLHYVPNAAGHVLAGDLLSPASTSWVEDRILEFLR